MKGIRDYQIEEVSERVSRYVKRLLICGLVGNGMSIGMISYNIGCDPATVTRWRDRQNIYDLRRSGRPLIYGEDVQLKVIGFYCQTQPLSASGRWSVRMAAAYLRFHPEWRNFSISKSTIFRILCNNNLKPHRSSYYLHISDPDFFPKMEKIVGLYRNPPQNLFCFDESPGIQVLQRLVPDLRTDKMKIRLEEFEYIRNGTIDLFACLEVSTGKVFAECYPCHNADMLVRFMEKHFLTIPDNEPIYYILDNLYTHCSYEICILVAKYSNVKCPPKKELNTMERRKNWLASEGKRIVFHFTPFHGSWLNMIEIWFAIIGEKCLNESFSSPEKMYESIKFFTSELWNNIMAHPFNWKYNGDGLHEKAVVRFTQNIKSNNILELDLRILTKQFSLIKNLFSQYRNLISEKSWNDLRSVFQKKIGDFRKKIENEQGPLRKKQACLALKELEDILMNIEENIA